MMEEYFCAPASRRAHHIRSESWQVSTVSYEGETSVRPSNPTSAGITLRRLPSPGHVPGPPRLLVLFVQELLVS